MLRINIKSFQWSYIQKTIFKINEIVSFFKLCNTKVIGLPVKKKIYTVLRSPHKDKKSREQFESRRWKAQIIINAENNKNMASLLFFLIKNSEFPGVELQVSLIKNSYL
jgi:small subunit ribosomal protein S10